MEYYQPFPVLSTMATFGKSRRPLRVAQVAAVGAAAERCAPGRPVGKQEMQRASAAKIQVGP